MPGQIRRGKRSTAQSLLPTRIAVGDVPPVLQRRLGIGSPGGGKENRLARQQRGRVDLRDDRSIHIIAGGNMLDLKGRLDQRGGQLGRGDLDAMSHMYFMGHDDDLDVSDGGHLQEDLVDVGHARRAVDVAHEERALEAPGVVDGEMRPEGFYGAGAFDRHGRSEFLESMVSRSVGDTLRILLEW